MKSEKVTIIIKALNEQKNISRTIESVIRATKKIDAEIILADALSDDKTVKIALKYPIRIVQLVNIKDRSCGSGPQLGYQYANGKYILIIDGDMELERNFLEIAINYLKQNPKLAGVAGQVKEMNTENMIFKSRKNLMQKKIGATDRLSMGGIYTRESINSVDYFSNRNLHAFEEAELGFRLINKGWKLERLNVPAIKHYGYIENSIKILKNRWKSGYAMGSGEIMRSSLTKGYVWRCINLCKINIFLIFFWLFAIIVLSTNIYKNSAILIVLLLLAVFFTIFVIKKRSIKDAFFSIIVWHYNTLGFIKGLFQVQINPKIKIKSRVLK